MSFYAKGKRYPLISQIISVETFRHDMIFQLEKYAEKTLVKKTYNR